MSDAPETLDQTIRRLKKERDEADARYNEALTEVDRALRPPVPLPDPALALDDQRSAEVNQAWNIIPAPPKATSWSQKRFVGLIWRTIAPYLERQLAFNSALVDHLNRNANAQRRAHDRALELTGALRAQMDQVEVFQARLMRLLQQVTAYVDTKDRDTAAGALTLN